MPQALKDAVRPTTFIRAPQLAKLLGVDLLIASETFQVTGSFKFRAAYNVVSKVRNEHFIAASSGNFGQALAHACQLLQTQCTVVMPENSVKVKVQAVRDCGANVDLIDVGKISRSDRLAQLAAEDPDAYLASPYDDPLVIEGNSSLGDEILATGERFDAVIVPVGGGGLLSGLLQSFSNSENRTAIIGAEPALANDAARSLREGRIIRNDHEPQTIADGARTVSVGRHNWPIIQKHARPIIEVPEENIIEGVRLLFGLANLKVEPTGALSIGAILTAPAQFAGQKICCVVSGGNVDASVYAECIGSRLGQ